MRINTLREQRRKNIAQQEIRNMIHKYDTECGKSITRKATQEEMQRDGRQTSEYEQGKFIQDALYTY